MRYQLVIQWSAPAIVEFESIIAIEDELVDNLSPAHEVDGHDIGAGEANIFIHTDDPVTAFAEVRAILGGSESWQSVRAAHRLLNAETWHVVWPIGATTFSVA